MALGCIRGGRPRARRQRLYAGWRWYRRHAMRDAPNSRTRLALERLEKARRDLMTPEHAGARVFLRRVGNHAPIHRSRASRSGPPGTRRKNSCTTCSRGVRQGRSPSYRESLEDVLNHCDLAKFARWQLSVPDMEAMHESARTFILETRPAADAKTPVAGSRNGNAPHTTEPQLTHS